MSEQTLDTVARKNSFFNHPKGLYILFFTEMWERFSYYGMRAIFILYLTSEAVKNPGLGWTDAPAYELYGWYTMMVYVMAVPGGWLADRFLGQKKTVMLGGILLCIGHFVLAIDSVEAFYTGCAFIVLGVGALKPNISTMVGGLYKKGDSRRDTGFTLFYIGINIGAFAAPLAVGYVGEMINWHLGFGMAGVGMFLGLIIYIWGQKYLKETGNLIPRHHADGTKKKLTPIERDRLKLLGLSFLIIIVFWGAYEQAGGLMNLYAKKAINRDVGSFLVPASFLQGLHAFYVILIGAPMAYFWVQWRKWGRESSSIFKMGVGTVFAGLGFVFLMGAANESVILPDETVVQKAALWWMFAAYLLHVIGELSLSPVALSFVTKLAPAKYGSLMMGAFFMVSGFGNKLAATVGKASIQYGEMAIFTGIFIFCTLFGLLVILFTKQLKKLAHGAEDVDDHIVMVEPE